MKGGYMGVFVVEESEPQKSCATCTYELAVDRAECNACAREWVRSGYTRHVGWHCA